jgi:predicted permease
MKFRWNRLNRELAEEMHAHIDEKTSELIEEGVPENEARERARREFGNPTLLTETSREVWSWKWLEQLLQDLRYGIRTLRRAPVFTAISIFSLALGIGANTAVFSLVDAILIKALPVRDPGQLRILTWVRTDEVPVESHSGYTTLDAKTGQNVSGSFSYPAYRSFRKNVSQFSDLVAYASQEFTVTAHGTSEYAYGQFVSDNFFTGLGALPLIGRSILPEDELPGKPRVAVLTYRYWEKSFGLDPAVLGREVLINQRPVIIIGVMPPSFQGLYPGRVLDVFVPMTLVPEMSDWYSLAKPDNWWVQIFGRLRPGVSEEAAASAVRATLQHEIEDYSHRTDSSAFPPVLLRSGARGVGLLRNSVLTSIYILSGTVGLVLSIACTNLANLLLARAAGRRREIAVRLSIGASRGRLLRQLFTESLLLSSLGGLSGLLLAKPLSQVLLRFAAGSEPVGLNVSLDARTLAFTLVISLATGLLFGIAPAWRATRVDLNPAIKAVLTSRGHLGRVLVSVQVALSVVLLIGAGLFVRTLVSLSNVDLGFRPERVLTFQTDPSRNGIKEQRLADLYVRMIDKIAAIPGVESVGMSQIGLIQGSESDSTIFIPGSKPISGKQIYILNVSSSFLGTMRIPLILGRGLSPADGPSSPLAAVVNEKFVSRYFPGEDPIGKSFYFGSKAPNSSSHPMEIVGVVKDAHYTGVRDEVPPTGYFPYSQQLPGLRQMTFAIRTALPPLAVAGAVRRAVAEIDRTIPVADLRTEEDQINSSLSTERLFAGLVSAFGGLAALLAAIGLYGVMAYTVARRTAEIGIRMALGANRANVQWLVLRESLLMVVLGLLAGLPAAFALTRFVKTVLFGVTPADPLSFLVALLLMFAVAAAAAWLPARRAARVDPMIALRYE